MILFFFQFVQKICRKSLSVVRAIVTWLEIRIVYIYVFMCINLKT